MQNSRTKNSILIMTTSGVRQILTFMLTFVSRTVFIKVLGAEYLGLNGLFSNILSLLSLSELGIGVAISFYLYKPLAENDINRIKVLMQLYKICYRIIGIAIICIGCCLIPILPHLVNFEQNVPVNLYVVYLLYLLNTAATYLFFAYKQALLTANQEQYKIEKINICFTFINCMADIVVLIIFRNYIAYLMLKFLLVLIKNIVIAMKIDKEYPYIKEKTGENLSGKEIKCFLGDMGSVSLFRLGSTLYNSTDNIIISILLGTAIVGYYSNYLLIISQITVAINVIIRSLTAGIGNVIAKESKEKQQEIFNQLDFNIYIVAAFCTACLFQLLNSFIKIWIGGVDENYILSQSVVVFLCISFYIDVTTQIPNSFREASGNFGTASYWPLLGGIINIILSVILGRLFGLVGIVAATVVSKVVITLTPFLVQVGRTVLNINGFEYVKKYYFRMFIMLILLSVLWAACTNFHMNGMGNFIIECILSVTIPLVLIYIIFRNITEMKALKCKAVSAIRKVTNEFKKNIKF